jgi:hypothetical protein
MNLSSRLHTFRLEPNFVTSLPLKKVYEWAVKHDAEKALLRILNEELFGWGNPDATIAVFFHDSEDTISFSHDGGVVEGSLGDVFFISSVIEKHFGYRLDVISHYEWKAQENRWPGKTIRSFYYSKSSPFGGFNKPMPVEWGLERNPNWRSPTFY